MTDKKREGILESGEQLVGLASPIRLSEIANGRRWRADKERQAVIRAYLDDSGDPRRKKFVAVGGLIAPSGNGRPFLGFDAWDAVDLRWANATHHLQRPFRSTDCETGHDQFSDWTEEDRRSLMRDLVDILADAPLVMMAIVVPVPDFVAVFPNLKEYDPYYLGVQYLMASLANFEQANEKQDLSFVFEDSNATSGKTLELFNELKSIRDWSGSKRLAGISFADKRVMALQAADLFAREAFKHFDNLEVPERNIRKPLQRMIGKAHICCPSRRALEAIRGLGWPDEIQGLAREAEIG